MDSDDRGTWTERGIYGGAHINGAFRALETVQVTANLCVDVLDAIHGHSGLRDSLALKQLFDDFRVDRVGPEWQMERDAIASQQTQEFREQWPELRTSIIENQLVSLCSALEHFVKMILAEFPSHGETAVEKRRVTDEDLESETLNIDARYRARMKKLGSASHCWVELCCDSCIPAGAKAELTAWLSSPDATQIDTLVLVRNVLVHRAGIADSRVASRTSFKDGERIKIDKAQFNRYSRACASVVVILYPSL